MPAESHSPETLPGKEMPTKDKDKDNCDLKRSPSSVKFKKLVPKVLRTGSMKNLFKSKKPPTPAEVVRQTRELLMYLDSDADAGKPKRDEKGSISFSIELEELDAHITEMKSILYGDQQSEPVPEACAQLTQEFFSDDTMRLLILCIPKLNFEARKDATRVVANLQRQPVQSRLIASDYLEANLDLMDQLITGYEDPVLALHYGGMLRECIRHQVVARYVLKSEHMKKFFVYIQLPNFDVASDAAVTFKFFAEFNSKLLESSNYMTRRHAIKLLGDILLDRSNSGVMIRYVSSKANMRVLMNLLRESHKSIQIDAFHVFKLFVANRNKPADIVNILWANQSKLLRFFDTFNMDKEDEMFEADKAQVMREIEQLVPTTPNCCSGELFTLLQEKINSGEMVVCFEATPKKLAATAALFLTGSALFGYGLHLWHVNAAPQQARIKARNEFVRDRLRKKYGNSGSNTSLSK
ncbi:hypothetical protein BUALT_Bualt03G0109200 [Buddleja alternifolia]|uniref:Uncharacterized protein n=1 Tax=Buddleja alternifolia TaxID=168488 RepID=A0AAV6Y407_9LAMI|nr:hypothetical protein BUALT_Bualt03G0109200 [Buddleja alternifolia]